MRRSSNCFTWRCATSRRNGPCRCTTGKPHSTALPSSTKIGCRLNRRETEEMKLPGKNPGYGNRGKTNCVFPPFPQPLLLVINQDEKAADLKTTDDRLHKIFDATGACRLWYLQGEL